MRNLELAAFFLRLGLGTAFLYAAISSFLDPAAWVGFFPVVVQQNLPVNLLLALFGLCQVVLAGWLFSSWKAQWAASLAALTLFLIIIFNVRGLDLVFRDVALLFAALALVSLSDGERRTRR